MATTAKHYPFQYVKTESKNEIIAGIITGQLAALIMAVVLMLVFTLFLDRNIFYPVQVIGSGLLGEEALIGVNFTAFIIGFLIHQLGPALIWGTVYGLVAAKVHISDSKNAVVLGLGITIVSMMIGPNIIVPWAMNLFHGVDIWNREVPMSWDWVAHVVFGASFALYPIILNKINIRKTLEQVQWSILLNG